MRAAYQRASNARGHGPEPDSDRPTGALFRVAGGLCVAVVAVMLGLGSLPSVAAAQFTPSTTGEGSQGLEGAQEELPQASPGDSLADERRENGELEPAPTSAIEGEPTTGLGSQNSQNLTTAALSAPDAANTPTGGMDPLGGPAWIVGAMFALGAAAAVIVVALRRMPASGRSTASGQIFEKPSQRSRRRR